MKTNKNYLIIKIKIIDDKHLLNNFYSKKHRIQQYERGKSFTKRFKRKPTYFSRWMNFDNIIWWFKIKVIYLSNE